MQRFTFRKGLGFIAGNKRWTLMRKTATGHFQLEEDNGEVITLTEVELIENWYSRKWLIDEAAMNNLAEVIYLVSPRDLSSFPERWAKQARRRLYYIDMVKAGEVKFSPETWAYAIKAAAVESKDPKPPSPSTVYSWWRKYQKRYSIVDLVPYASRKARDSCNRDIRYSIFTEVISSTYLSNQQLPKIEVYKRVQEEIHRLNLSSRSNNPIKYISHATIYRWLNELQQDIVDACRLGVEAAKVKYRLSMGGLKVDEILQRVEIDHTPIDLIVYDDNTNLPLGRPWITLAIDKYSRLILGFYVSFNAPSAHSVLQCLKHMILPKELWLRRYPEIKNKWPAMGIPYLIAVDNGMDLHSDAVRDACEELGIQLLFCPAGDPTSKGSIERFMRTISSDLFHQLPGTVFSNVNERGDYPSETESAINLETLLKLVTLWIVDVYNVDMHRGIKTSPYLAWMESLTSTNTNLPMYPDSIDIITGIPAERTVFHYGIELDGIHYNSPLLQEIRREAGSQVKVHLKFYEDTVSYIHVLHKKADGYIRVDAVNQEYTSDISRHLHRMIRASARKELGERHHIQDLIEARTNIQETIKAALTDKRMATRKRAAKTLMHDSSNLNEGLDPLQMAMKPTKKPKVHPPAPLPDGLEDPLPHISTLGLPSLDLTQDDDEDQQKGPKI